MGNSKIVIGSIENNLSEFLAGRKVVVVTDAKAHGGNRAFIDSFENVVVIGQGEGSKNLNTLEEVYRKLLDYGADRSTLLLGVGGGIVTDITGFAASTFMRGISFGFVPTTLLGQVDAAVGGKNGVNLDGYKNIIGLFSQPEFVLCDTSLLVSLSDKDFRSGIAEVIKVAIIGDPALFELLERHSFDDIRHNKDLQEEIIGRAIKIKMDIVGRDEKEYGERRKLNLGHTFAHAIEKSSPLFSHGEAVAAGMVAISEAAVESGILNRADADRIKSVIEKMDLPVSYSVEMKQLLNAIKFDKKRERESIHIVFPKSIGSCEVRKMDMSEFEGLFIPK